MWNGKQLIVTNKKTFQTSFFTVLLSVLLLKRERETSNFLDLKRKTIFYISFIGKEGREEREV